MARQHFYAVHTALKYGVNQEVDDLRRSFGLQAGEEADELHLGGGDKPVIRTSRSLVFLETTGVSKAHLATKFCEDACELRNQFKRPGSNDTVTRSSPAAPSTKRRSRGRSASIIGVCRVNNDANQRNGRLSDVPAAVVERRRHQLFLRLLKKNKLFLDRRVDGVETIGALANKAPTRTAKEQLIISDRLSRPSSAPRARSSYSEPSKAGTTTTLRHVAEVRGPEAVYVPPGIEGSVDARMHTPCVSSESEEEVITRNPQTQDILWAAFEGRVRVHHPDGVPYRDILAMAINNEIPIRFHEPKIAPDESAHEKPRARRSKGSFPTRMQGSLRNNSSNDPYALVHLR
eukprot:GEMP01038640.1.p1 GENE.GEMP01038640.1~~GEMP01038640.1.p1  ORF type:complete len:346 (+),score=73.61 GEMP01038640.1:34-1071(+)